MSDTSSTGSKIQINPGTILLVPSSRVDGGKTRSTRKVKHDPINAGDGERIEYDVKVEVQDKEERANAEKLIQQALHAIRSRSTCTPIGYLADSAQLAEIVQVYGKIKLAGENFNKVSKFSKVSVSFAPFEIGSQLVSNEECAKALADHVRGELQDLHGHLSAGDVNGVRNVLLRCKRMHTLAVGTQGHAIKFAIEEAGGALRALREKIKGNETPESAGRSLTLPMIDAAIETFTYAPENHAPELPADLDLSGAGAGAGALPAGSAAPAAPAAMVAA
jgi:hypothetical protein